MNLAFDFDSLEIRPGLIAPFELTAREPVAVF